MFENKLVYNLEGLMHYTNINNLECILKKRTWKLSNILSMNDKKEKLRNGITDYTIGHVFLASFVNTLRENHAMWHIYGKDEKASRQEEKNNKILLSLNKECFFNDSTYEKDFMLYPSGEKKSKCYFGGYEALRNGENTDVQLSEIINVEYLDNNHDIFNKKHGYEVMNNGQPALRVMYTTDIGKHKTKSWDYEEEIRVRVMLFPVRTKATKPTDNYLLLRLKDDFFRDMIIILSPWDDGSSESKVKKIIEAAELQTEIKDSIKIVKSSEYGMFE